MTAGRRFGIAAERDGRHAVGLMHAPTPVLSRRGFLFAGSAAASVSLLSAAAPTRRGGASAGAPHVSTNTYPWGTFARREGRTYPPHADALLADIAASGIAGYEPAARSAAEFDGLAARLRAHGLEMRSLYVNSTLHDDAQAERSRAEVVAIARRARELGAGIIVTNPSPIRWGGPENKSDAQLRVQAQALDALGAELRQLGMTLAYHNHDIELRHGGREFHHMLTATDPRNVKLCLDAHWVFRGCGNSQVALFDAVEHYGARIVELHLRQSREGVWTEVFTAEGDIDYRRLRDWLQGRGLSPLLVLEQAVEKGSASTVAGVEAHRRSADHVRALFGVA